jgi:hypothetical protein
MKIRGLTALLTLTIAVSLVQVAPAVALEVLGSPFGNGEGGIAVDPITGDVYQAEPTTNRVSKYDQNGTFILTFGKGVDETTGADVCTAESGDTCKPGIPGLGEGELDTPGGVAVDPATQDVYVNAGAGGFLHEDNRVERFTSSGEYVSQIVGGQNGAPLFVIEPFVSGIAVDTEGNLYVASDEAGGSGGAVVNGVFKFNPAGDYTGHLFQLHGVSPLNVAVDANGAVYVSRSFHRPVLKFAPNGTELGQLPCRLGAEPGLTVNLFNGEVFVAGADEFNMGPELEEPYVCRYDAAGNKIEEFPAAQNKQQPHEMAYGASVGRLYEVLGNEVWMYGTFSTPPAGAPSVSREDWSNPALTTMTISARVDPHSLDTSYFFQYSTSPDLSGATSIPVVPGDAGSSFLPVNELANPTGLAQSTTYYYRLVAENSYEGHTIVDGPTQTFTTLAPLPSVTTGEASEVANDGATVNGTVIPGSTGTASDTLWCFQYGATGAPPGVYDLGFLPGAPAGDAGQGTEGVPVSVRLTRLQPETTYRYRLVAVNSLGSRLPSTACGSEGGHETDGAEGTFTTGVTGPGPLATSGPLAALTPMAATLTGSVDPQGTSTVYDFQLGTDTSYGVDLFGPAGAGGESEPVSVIVSSLQPGTTYHYRLVASSRFGTGYGADMSFTTPAVPSSVLVAPPAPPLIATSPFVFPGEAVVTTPRAVTCKRGYVRDKHDRCVKAKPKRKAKRRGKGARHKGK